MKKTEPRAKLNLVPKITKSRLIRISFAFGLLFLFVLMAILQTNHYVKTQGSQYILQPDQVTEAEAVLVLGAYVFPDGLVSQILEDRLIVGHALYREGKAPKIIVSGDHGQTEYDEVNAMKDFLRAKNVPSEDVFMDHAGFSTYESIYRARDIFKVKKLIIVTQEYHLMRAVFIARALGLEAYGIASDRRTYRYMAQYEMREIIARNKDFWMAKVFQPEPTFLGDEIPVSGDGRTTEDKQL